MQIHPRSPYHQKLPKSYQEKIQAIEHELALLLPRLKQQKKMERKDIKQLHKKIASLYEELRDFKRRAAF